MLPSAKGVLWRGQPVQFLSQQEAELALQWFGDILRVPVHTHFASLRRQVSSEWLKSGAAPGFSSDANTFSSSPALLTLVVIYTDELKPGLQILLSCVEFWIAEAVQLL